MDEFTLPIGYLREKLDAADNLLSLIAKGDEMAIMSFEHYLESMDKEIQRHKASVQSRKESEK
ncbi:hypothetical protein [Neptunomonas sp.]|uniref:hypothetical protein n=1 Tax=Neptunomonas sp. TaxID=1971898 RepID=UPI00356953AA